MKTQLDMQNCIRKLALFPILFDRLEKRRLEHDDEAMANVERNFSKDFQKHTTSIINNS